MQIEPSKKSMKSRLRKELRARRAGVSETQRNPWDCAIRRHIAEYTQSTGPAVVAAYLAFDGEPDLLPLLEELDELGVRLALPVVTERPGKAVISFRRWACGSGLQLNRYGIAEPAGTQEMRVTEIDLVLIPLVGWDRQGGRLGMGASFYDRLFQPFAELDRPRRMGVAYELQCVDRLPREPWDIGLHDVFTENGRFTCED